jgi:hypothetical protein
MLFGRGEGDDDLFEFVASPLGEFKLERLFSLNDENLNRDVIEFCLVLQKKRRVLFTPKN